MLICQFTKLLAALKQPATAPAPAPPLPAPPAAVPPMPAMPPAPNSYYPPPSAAYPPPPNTYNSANTPQSAAAPANLNIAANPALANLPPNILALLQSAQQPQRPPAPGQPYGMAPPTAHLMNGTIPPDLIAATGQNATNPQYQQLVAYLVRNTSLFHAPRLNSVSSNRRQPLRPLLGSSKCHALLPPK